MAKPRKTSVATVADLLKEGKANGFVTQEDILVLFPKPEDHIKELDQLCDKLIRAGIDIFETTSQEADREAGQGPGQGAARVAGTALRQSERAPDLPGRGGDGPAPFRLGVPESARR